MLTRNVRILKASLERHCSTKLIEEIWLFLYDVVKATNLTMYSLFCKSMLHCHYYSKEDTRHYKITRE